jgi:predicted NBD/HSP70 family sugar kinase
VLAAVVDAGTATRAELAARTGMSSSGVNSIVTALAAEGLVEEAAPSAGTRRGRGRPAAQVTLKRTSTPLGLDLGNSHIRVAVGSPGGQSLHEVVEQFDVGSSPGSTLDAAAEMTRKAIKDAGHGLHQIGTAVMGVPAPVDAVSGRIASNNILPAWVSIDPGAELQRRLGVRVVVENDANLGAIGEHQWGAAQGANSLIYVKLATGIGAGLLLGGRLQRGAGGTAGEIGHVQVDPDGKPCRCGARGCLETVASLPPLVAALRYITDEKLDYAGLGRLLEAGNAGARRVVADAGRAIGRTIADMSTILNPSAIVIGGPVTSANEIVSNCIRSSIDQFAQPAAAAHVSVHASSLGDRSEVLGALYLANTIARDSDAVL